MFFYSMEMGLLLTERVSCRWHFLSKSYWGCIIQLNAGSSVRPPVLLLCEFTSEEIAM